MNNKISKYLTKMSTTDDYRKKYEYILHLHKHTRIQLGGDGNVSTPSTDEIEDKFKKLRELIEEILTHKNESSSNLSQKDNEIISLKNVIASQKDELEKRMIEINDLTSRLGNTINDKAEYDKLKIAVEELQKLINEKDLNIEDLEKLINKLDLELKNNKTECDKKLEKYIQIFTELLTGETPHNLTSEEEEKIKNFRIKLEEKFNNINNTKENINKLELTISELQNKIIELTSEKNKLEETNKKNNDDFNLVKNKFNTEYNNLIDLLTSNNKKLDYAH